jgi:putative nucleotidyltransferase with HDIG domain
MNRLNTYSLTMSGVLILTLTAQGMFLAPQLNASVLGSLPRWQIDLFGWIFFFLSIFLIAAVVLDYSRSAHAWVYLYTAVALGSMSLLMLEKGLYTESALLAGLTLAFLFSNWIRLGREWLLESIQWVNVYVGFGLFLRPDLFVAGPQYEFFRPDAVRYSFVTMLLASALASFLLNWKPELGAKRQALFLASPWVMWGLLLLTPLQLPSVIISWGVSVALLFRTFIPWNKLVLRQGALFGRQIFHLVFVAEFIAIVLVLWLIRQVDAQFPVGSAGLYRIREITFVVFSILSLVALLVVATVNLAINGVLSGLNGSKTDASETKPTFWGLLKESLLQPFTVSQNLLSDQMRQQREYEALMARTLNNERHRMAQINLLHQLNLELESILEPAVSAQLTANAIYNAFSSPLSAVLQYDAEREELVLLAASGPLTGNLPSGYRQGIGRGLIGRAARLRRTQLASDTRLDPDFFQFENQNSLSELIIPLLYHNRLEGVIVVDRLEPNAFKDSDVRTLETVAVQLVTSWERGDHDERLTNLISAGVTLSTTLDVEGVIKEIAEITRKTLDARFVFVALVDKGGGYTRTAYVGYAPNLVNILNSDPAGNVLIQTALNSAAPFRLRDVRKRFSSTNTDNNDLRSLLAFPLHLRQSSIGVVLAFGKQGNVTFSESDESLASLLAAQAAAAIESTWLYQELRLMFTTTTQLYQLSTHVLGAEHLSDAAAYIAETAYQVSKGQAAGIILLTPESKEIEARVQVDENGIHPGAQHPMELVEQVLENGQNIIVSGPNDLARVCLPLETPRRKYGALWVEVPEANWYNARFSDNLHTLANQAAIALERSILLVETRKQAAEIKAAYRELELTYDQTLVALSSALDARDRETEGHSMRVTRMSCALARRMGFNEKQTKIMERGAVLHDIGKIGISDTILLKPGALTESEWQLMRQHPDIGARIIEGIPFLQEAMPVIRYHQERWDGSGYPIGLKETDIPLMARIFSVVDAYDALTSKRPYRTPITTEGAVDYLKTQAGIAFDPAVVAEFCQMVADGMLKSLI